MKQNKSWLGEKNIEISSAVYTNNKIWMVAGNFNSLFSMDMKSKETKLVGIFPNEPYSQVGLFLSSILVKKRIYFIPFLAKNIAIYDIENNTFDSIKLDINRINGRDKKGYFIGVQKYNNYLFLIPAFLDVIVRLDTDNYNIEYITEWVEKTKKEIIFEGDLYFRGQSLIKDNKLYIPFFNTNGLLELNCDTLESVVHKLGDEKKGYTGICYKDDNFWLSGRTYDELIKWNLESKEKQIVYEQDEVRKEDIPNCLGLACYGKRLFIFTTKKNMGTYNENEEDIVLISEKCIFVKEDDEYIFYFYNDTMIVINKISGDKFIAKVTINKKLFNLQRVFEEKKIVKEDQEINLEDFLFQLSKKNEQ